MAAYKVYCYDGAGKLWVADDIEAASDEEAIAVANNLKSAVTCEVWERGRLVATIGPQPREGR